MRRLRVIAAAAVVGLVGLAGCGGGSGTKAAVTTIPATTIPTTTLPPQDVGADTVAGKAAALMLSDLPKGWTATPHIDTPSSPGVDTAIASCIGVTVAQLNQNGPADVNSPDFSDAAGNTIANSVGYSPTAATAREDFATSSGPKFSGCLATALNNSFAHPATPGDTMPPGVTIGKATVVRLSVPTIGDDSAAYRLTALVSGRGRSVTLFLDSHIALKGRAGVIMDFGSLNIPFLVEQEQHYMSLVLGRLTRT